MQELTALTIGNNASLGQAAALMFCLVSRMKGECAHMLPARLFSKLSAFQGQRLELLVKKVRHAADPSYIAKSSPNQYLDIGYRASNPNTGGLLLSRGSSTDRSLGTRYQQTTETLVSLSRAPFSQFTLPRELPELKAYVLDKINIIMGALDKLNPAKTSDMGASLAYQTGFAPLIKLTGLPKSELCNVRQILDSNQYSPAVKSHHIQTILRDHATRVVGLRNQLHHSGDIANSVSEEPYGQPQKVEDAKTVRRAVALLLEVQHDDSDQAMEALRAMVKGAQEVERFLLSPECCPLLPMWADAAELAAANLEDKAQDAVSRYEAAHLCPSNRGICDFTVLHAEACT
jgi:hypothetical protein